MVGDNPELDVPLVALSKVFVAAEENVPRYVRGHSQSHQSQCNS